MSTTNDRDRRPRGAGTVSWNERRRRWLIRAVPPAAPHAKPRPVDRWLADPAKYAGAWPSVAGKKAAEQALEQLVYQLEAQSGSALNRGTARLDGTISLDRYVKTRWSAWLDLNTASEANPEARLRPRTVEEYRRSYRTRISDVLGHRSVASLLPSDADALVAILRRRGLSDASCRRAVVILRSILKSAAKDGLVPAGSEKLFDLPSGAVAHDVKVPTATPEQIAALLTASSGPQVMTATPTAAALALVCATGMRRSEALALLWTDIDLAERTVSITKGLTETSKGELVTGRTKSKNSSRTVRIPEELAQNLAQLRSARPEAVYVAESNTPGVPTRPSQAARAGKKMLRDVGISEGGWHAIRHGISEMLLAEGHSPFVVARQLGHTPEVNLAHYGGKQEVPVLDLGDELGELLAS